MCVGKSWKNQSLVFLCISSISIKFKFNFQKIIIKPLNVWGSHVPGSRRHLKTSQIHDTPKAFLCLYTLDTALLFCSFTISSSRSLFNSAKQESHSRCRCSSHRVLSLNSNTTVCWYACTTKPGGPYSATSFILATLAHKRMPPARPAFPSQLPQTHKGFSIFISLKYQGNPRLCWKCQEVYMRQPSHIAVDESPCGENTAPRVMCYA
jgi:hypothetical protein